MWFLKDKKKPELNFSLSLSGPTVEELLRQQQDELAEVSAEHAKRIKELNKQLSQMGHPCGETMRNREAELRRQIKAAKDEHKAAGDALRDKHRKVNEARAQRTSDAITQVVTTVFSGWLKDRDDDWLLRLITLHEQVKGVVRSAVGRDLNGMVYVLRLAEAMLLHHGPAKTSDYAHGINISGTNLLWALEAGDLPKVRAALTRMELALRDVNHGLAPIENPNRVWRRRLTTDFAEF